MRGTIWLLGLCLLLDAALAVAQPAHDRAYVIDIDGAIGPATADYVDRSLQQAQDNGAVLVVLRMDTPGGLDTAMRSIIKRILASRVPVVGFVAPSGARAASAGTYIMYACQVAAMAPGTNLGAATPVQLIGLPGGGSQPENNGGAGKSAEMPADAEKSKLVNDAVAYLQSLARLRGRNESWAEQAVRSAASLPAEQALKIGVIDLMAADLQQLLTRLDGRVVQVNGTAVTLHTAGLELVPLAPDWRSRLLSVIGNPNIAFILMLVGLFGLIYEFSNPGAVLPGVTGAVSLLLALYAFQVLPVNYAGVALILLGLGLIAAEAFVPSFGALGVGGIIAFVFGSLILFDSDLPGYSLSVPLVLTVALLSGLLLLLLVGMMLRAHRRPVTSGSEELVGATGTALADFAGSGKIRIHGEVWTARSGVGLRNGQPVRVVGRDALTLLVEPLESQPDEN